MTMLDRNELNQLKEEIQSLREKVTCQKDELQSLKRNMIHREADIEAVCIFFQSSDNPD